VVFHKYVQDTIDWGKDKRLKQIRESLDNLLEQSRRRTSEAAKSLPPPSDDCASSSSYKRKDSSSRGHNSRVKSVQKYPSGVSNAQSSGRFQGSVQDGSLAQTPAVDSDLYQVMM
jgi:hypothetical protein